MKSRIIFTLWSLLAFIFLASPSIASSIKLRITYNGAGVANSDITVKNGDVALGSGRTDGNGDVSISVSTIVSRQIDVYGEKNCGGTKKTWNVRGFANLDDNNFFHLKMEDVMKEMSGMGMSESMLASAWGISASGCNDSPSSGSAQTTDSEGTAKSDNTASDSDSDLKPVDLAQMREDQLKVRRTGLENEIDLHQRRIAKQSGDLAGLRRDGADNITIRRAEIDLALEKLKKEKKELDLEQVVAKLDGPALSKDRSKAIDQRIEAISVETDGLKAEEKDLKNEEKAIRKEEKFEDMGKMELRKNLADLKMKRSNKKLKLKVNGKTMSKSKRSELEAEIQDLDQQVERYQNRLEELKGEGDEEEEEPEEATED